MDYHVTKSREGLKRAWEMGEWISEENLGGLAGGAEDRESGMALRHIAEGYCRLFCSTGDQISCTGHHLNGV